MFQHRHYKAIAAVLADLDGHEIGLSIGTAEAINSAMADMFAVDNPRFDRARFLAACDGAPTNKKDEV